MNNKPIILTISLDHYTLDKFSSYRFDVIVSLTEAITKNKCRYVIENKTDQMFIYGSFEELHFMMYDIAFNFDIEIV